MVLHLQNLSGWGSSKVACYKFEGAVLDCHRNFGPTKFWSRGPNFLENWSARPLFSENFGPRMELWSEQKYFGMSTFNDTRLCLYSITN